ncbi:hypothetical protein [Halalkalibacterium halodurans]|uniref:hypothetical protein n=1 Tax=Halalkalibacterium halodurans TaxID=86665 RepID=UPI0010FDE085|nr:hypothetical protein [Halalkalibacterium halodurans]MED4161444.1 hypothetical protein [Halalkalibacterium halodurans]
MGITINPDERNFVKIGAILGIIGTLLYIFASAIHGNPPIEEAETLLPFLADSTLWREVHLANIAAIFLWLASFIILTSLLSNKIAIIWSKVANSFMIMTCGVFALYFHIHSFALPLLATKWVSADEETYGSIVIETNATLTMLGTTAFISQAMLGLSIILYGIVLLFVPVLKRWLAYLGIIAGLGWLIGAIIIDFSIIVRFTVLAWIWVFLVCTLLLLNMRSTIH